MIPVSLDIGEICCWIANNKPLDAFNWLYEYLNDIKGIFTANQIKTFILFMKESNGVYRSDFEDYSLILDGNIMRIEFKDVKIESEWDGKTSTYLELINHLPSHQIELNSYLRYIIYMIAVFNFLSAKNY